MNVRVFVRRCAAGLAVSVGSIALFGVGTAMAGTFNANSTATFATAVASANNTPGSNTIVLAPNSEIVPTSTVTFTNTSGTTTIEGPATAGTQPDSNNATLTATSVMPFPSDFIDVDAGATVVFQDVTIANGGDSTSGTPSINDMGTLTLDDVSLDGNSGPAVQVQPSSVATLKDTTLAADSYEGIVDSGTVSLFNSTVAFNAGGIDDSQGVLNLTNSIVAENPSNGDCIGLATANGGTVNHSIDSDGTCVGGKGSNPKLYDKPVFNGGTTQTLPLEAGSPAIGAGDSATCLSTDQRGITSASPCDLGAEAYSAASLVLTVPADITVPETSSAGADVDFTVSASTAGGWVQPVVCRATLPAGSGAVDSGALFPVGTTPVTCTAQDYRGNTVTKSFNVTVSSAATLTPQAITFTTAAPTGATVGGTYTVAATGGGSGNPVVFTIDSAASTAGACTIATATVTFTGPGTCVIDANQAGNSTYSTAPMVQQTITVAAAAKATQTISFTSTAPTAPVFGGSYTVTATGGGSGNAVVFSIDPSSTAGACSVSGSSVSFTGVGTCTIDANQAGSSTYLAAMQVQQSFTILQAAQAIAFTSTPPGGATAGGSYTVAATGGASGNAVTFTIDSSSTSGACSVSATTVSFVAAGTCVIDANQLGNADYLAAPQQQQTFTIAAGTKTGQAITFTSTPPSSPAVGGSYTVTATGGASGNAVTFTIDASSTSGACAIAAAVVSFTGPGSCVIDANQAGNTTYSAAPQVQQTLTIALTAQVITFTSTPPSSPTVGGTYTVTATGGASGNAVTFTIDASSTSGACSIAAAVVSFTGPGSCVIDANQAGNTTYSAAPQVQQKLTIAAGSKTPQTITFTSTPPSSPTVGGTYTVTASGGKSGNAVTFTIDASSTSGACSIAAAVVSFTGPGSCVIDANQAGNTTYAAAPQVQQKLTIAAGSKTPQVITFTSTPPTSPTVGGTYTVTATGGASGNAVTFTIDGSSTSGACAIAAAVVSFTGPGSCVIDANQAGNTTYSAAPQVQQKLTVAAVVTKAPQAIAFTSAPPASPTVGGSYTVTASGGKSGNAVTFTIDASSTSGACSIAAAVVSFTGPGSCVIDANQAGNTTYSAAPQVQQKLTVAAVVTKSPQAIAFTSAPPASPTVGGSYTVTASGGKSGNAVTFTIDASSTSGACSIAAAVVSFTGPGSCVIDANQAGNTTYSAAPQVQQKLTIVATSPASKLQALLAQVRTANIPFWIRARLVGLLEIILRELTTEHSGLHVNSTVERGDRGPSWTCAGQRGSFGDACWTLAEVNFLIEIDQFSWRPEIPTALASSWEATIRSIQSTLCGDWNWGWSWRSW
jgi:multisubunit Na+/H+ antiporter MnhE subunit